MTRKEFMKELDQLLDEYCWETSCDKCPGYLTCCTHNKYELSDEHYTVELVENILTDKRSENK